MISALQKNFRRIKTVFSREIRYFTLRPREVNIELTHLCNLKCKMCGVWTKDKGRRAEELTPTEYLSLFTQLREMGITLVTLAGGEPFIRRDLFDIIGAAKSRHLACNIFTNGTLIDSESIKKIFEYDLDKVIVSLDGMHSTHDTIRGREGSFDKAARFLSNLINEKRDRRSAKPELDVHMTIMGDNVQDIQDLNAFCQKIGANFSFQICSVSQSLAPEHTSLSKNIMGSTRYLSRNDKPIISDEDTLILRRTLDTLPSNFYTKLIRSFDNDDLKTGRIPVRKCYITRNFMMIDPYGNVFPCTNLDNHFTGNIKNESLINIWHGNKYDTLRKNLSQNLLPLCKSCCHLVDNLTLLQLAKIILTGK
jgi:radical SAM protein with 4Fe4S-binding SPASM domain